MKSRTIAAAGLAVAIAAAILIAATASFNLGAGLMVGIFAGASVALVPNERGPRKITAFLVGVLATAGVYILRAGVLPDAMIGTLIAAVALIGLLTVVAALSKGRIPLWASFAGAAAMAGAYETLHLLDFAALTTNLPIALAAVLIASAVGFTAASLVNPAAPAKREDAEPVDQDVPMDFDIRELVPA